MNYSLFIFFLLTLSFLSLLMLVSLWMLDVVNANAKQKLIFLKIGFTTIALSPFCFIFMRLHFPNNLIITLTSEFINQNILSNAGDILIMDQIDWYLYISITYLIGLMFMLVRILLSYLSATSQLRLSIPANIQGELIFKCDHIQNPLCFGLVKPQIYFPRDAELKWTEREIQLCLAHEKHHIKQYDPFWKLLSQITQALLFFTPWMYYLNRRFELEMEIHCDLNVCTTTNASIYEYGHLLLAMASVQSHNFTFNNMTDSTLKRRLIAMKMKTKNVVVLASILSSVLLLTSLSAVVMASGFTLKKNYFKISSKIIVDGKVVSNPVILAKENQPALIVITNTNHNGAQGLRMKLVAANATRFGLNKAVEINYDIEYKNGSNEMRANPHIIVEPNQEEKIKLSSNAEHVYEMQVIAERE